MLIRQFIGAYPVEGKCWGCMLECCTVTAFLCSTRWKVQLHNWCEIVCDLTWNFPIILLYVFETRRLNDSELWWEMYSHDLKLVAVEWMQSSYSSDAKRSCATINYNACYAIFCVTNEVLGQDFARPRGCDEISSLWSELRIVWRRYLRKSAEYNSVEFFSKASRYESRAQSFTTRFCLRLLQRQWISFSRIMQRIWMHDR